MDAVVASVSVLEGQRHHCLADSRLHAEFIPLDCPLFNAGKGAVFNTDGKVSAGPGPNPNLRKGATDDH